MQLLPASYTAHAQSADHSWFGQRTAPVRIDPSFTYLANPSVCKMGNASSSERLNGAIQTTKISGNFGPKLNGSVQSNRKSFENWSTFWGGPLFPDGPVGILVECRIVPFCQLNERFGEHRWVHRRSILNHHYSATPLNSFQSTWTFNQRRSSQFPLEVIPSNIDAVREQGRRGTQRQFSENICSKDDWRSRIFGTFIVKFLAYLPLLGFSNI